MAQTQCLSRFSDVIRAQKGCTCYDNSMMGTFFPSIKREELYRTKYRSEKEFIAAVEKYIAFYIEKRLMLMQWVFHFYFNKSKIPKRIRARGSYPP